MEASAFVIYSNKGTKHTVDRHILFIFLPGFLRNKAYANSLPVHPVLIIFNPLVPFQLNLTKI